MDVAGSSADSRDDGQARSGPPCSPPRRSHRPAARRRHVVVLAITLAVAAATAGLVAVVVPAAVAAPACPAGTTRAAGNSGCTGVGGAQSMVPLDSCDTFATYRVCGLIRERYLRLGGPGGFLGVPKADEQPAGAGGVGRVSHLVGGDILWSPDSGAWEVHGAVAAKWAAAGGPGGALGFPTSNVGVAGGVESSRFEGGSVVASAGTGAHAVLGAVDAAWRERGGPAGLGLPVTDTVPAHGGRQVSFFQGGTIYWSAHGGVEVYTRSVAVPLGQDAETVYALLLADFIAVRAVRYDKPVGELVWSSDGCSGGVLTPASVDAFFRNACLRHDFGYRNFRTGPRIDPSVARKLAIDTVFLADLLATCEAAGQPRVRWHAGISAKCGDAARLMYRAVRLAP